jgi:tRNA(fMet)-specific endonuclease VapC
VASSKHFELRPKAVAEVILKQEFYFSTSFSMSQQVYDWKRFWCPRSSQINLGGRNYGLLLNPQHAQKIEPVMTSFLGSVTVLPSSTSESEKAAEIHAVLKTQGQSIGAYDVLIAATALQHQLIMVTANQQEFNRAPGLQTENWRQI